jgi:hypothetical protein
MGDAQVESAPDDGALRADRCVITEVHPEAERDSWQVYPALATATVKVCS